MVLIMQFWLTKNKNILKVEARRTTNVSWNHTTIETTQLCISARMSTIDNNDDVTRCDQESNWIELTEL